MSRFHGPPEEFLPAVVGKVFAKKTGIIGSCFALDSRRVLTSWHVITASADEIVVSWPMLGEEHTAVVEFADEANDLVVLGLPTVTCALVPEFANDMRTGEFVTFGYRHADDFNGLHARGTMLGAITSSDKSQRLLQIQSPTVDRGMSGAPIFVSVDGEWLVAGVVAGTWEGPGSRDRETAFVVPARELLPACVATPGTTELDDSEQKLLEAALYLAKDRFDDGAWGRSFRPQEGAFSQDIRSAVGHEGKRALSVTALAGIALLRVGGELARPFAAQSKPYIMTAYLPTVGAFGYVHRKESATPFVLPVSTEMANPRHTGSALSYLLEVDGPSRVAARAIDYLTRSADPDGGWGEGLGSGRNTMATIYVINALTKCISMWDSLIPYFEPHVIEEVHDGVVQCVDDALRWLIRCQRPDGTWLYLDSAGTEALAPAYAAYVAAFAPEVFRLSARTTQRFTGFVNRQLEGHPDATGQPGEADRAARWLMISFGLRQSGLEGMLPLADRLTELASKFLQADQADSTRTLAYTFLLLNHAADATRRSRGSANEIVGRAMRGFALIALHPDIFGYEASAAWSRSLRMLATPLT